MIRLVLADVDGTMTDGGIIVSPNGEVSKRFCVRDGAGLCRLIQAGIKVYAVSGRDDLCARLRMLELGVHFEHCQGDKGQVAEAIQRDFGISIEETAAIGDDDPDIGLFNRARLKFCPSDATPSLYGQANYRLKARAGHGAVREMADLILRGA